MPERVHTTLRFIGDWPWWVGATLALLAAVAAWLLYRRETRRHGGWTHTLLPLLRALAVAMILLMLSGPVLHHRKIIGELSHLWLFVDGSRSMGLADPSMESARKLAILQQLGLLRGDVAKLDLPQAGAALEQAWTSAERVRLQGNVKAEEWPQAAAEFQQHVQEADRLFSAAAPDAGRPAAMRTELVEPASKLAGRPVQQSEERRQAAAEMVRLGGLAHRWTGEIDELFSRSVREQSAAADSPLRAALAKFDALPRWQRLQSLLLEGEKVKLLAQLAARHDVQLFTMEGAAAKSFWQPSRAETALPSALPPPLGVITNLATALKKVAGGDHHTEKGAVVLFSDGQHNEGESPLEVARLLAARGVPIYTVGFGATHPPRDLAFVKVEAPEAVFYEERVHGQITFKDDMPAGLPFTLSLKDGEHAVWEQKLVTDGKGLRTAAFDFPMTDLVKERLKTRQSNQLVSGVPLDLAVVLSAVEGDSLPENNRGSLRLRAVTQKRRILLLDGRPRWESRYLRNLFERDEQWEMNAVIAGASAGTGEWVRGAAPGQFPEDEAALDTYDLVIFGDVPKTLFKGAELQWLQDFVAKRGGAVAFIDGPRERLREYADTPVGPLLPVSWIGPGVRQGIVRLELSAQGMTSPPFTMAPDPAQNADLWQHLPTPHWVAAVAALPGAETLLEAETAERKLPAAIYRPYGAGKVFYQAFDDSWRWRFEVADLHHVRYWNQVANFVAELPFAVRDKFVSLDAGAITYQPGDAAEVRVRLRDGSGKPVANATVDAVLSRDGKRIATLRLAPDENAGGLFRGRTGALEPGAYEVSVESAAIPATELKARTEFKVEPRETGELTLLNLDEELLRGMATASGGQYLREEELFRLPSLLAPMSQGRVIESDTVLWQSYWWFGAIVLLLACEWIMRKRSGLP